MLLESTVKKRKNAKKCPECDIHYSWLKDAFRNDQYLLIFLCNCCCCCCCCRTYDIINCFCRMKHVILLAHTYVLLKITKAFILARSTCQIQKNFPVLKFSRNTFKLRKGKRNSCSCVFTSSVRRHICRLYSWKVFPNSARSYWLLRGHMTSNDATVSRQNL